MGSWQPPSDGGPPPHRRGARGASGQGGILRPARRRRHGGAHRPRRLGSGHGGRRDRNGLVLGRSRAAHRTVTLAGGPFAITASPSPGWAPPPPSLAAPCSRPLSSRTHGAAGAPRQRPQRNVQFRCSHAGRTGPDRLDGEAEDGFRSSMQPQRQRLRADAPIDPFLAPAARTAVPARRAAIRSPRIRPPSGAPDPARRAAARRRETRGREFSRVDRPVIMNTVASPTLPARCKSRTTNAKAPLPKPAPLPVLYTCRHRGAAPLRLRPSDTGSRPAAEGVARAACAPLAVTAQDQTVRRPDGQRRLNPLRTARPPRPPAPTHTPQEVNANPRNIESTHEPRPPTRMRRARIARRGARTDRLRPPPKASGARAGAACAARRAGPFAPLMEP